jgi:hypothetical protein
MLDGPIERIQQIQYRQKDVTLASLPTPRSGLVLEVEAQDGTTTLLELSKTEDYALPQGSLGSGTESERRSS